MFVRFMLWAFVACFCWSNSARAEITYELVTTDGFSPYLVISGEFDEEYDVEQLKLGFRRIRRKNCLLQQRWRRSRGGDEVWQSHP